MCVCNLCVCVCVCVCAQLCVYVCCMCIHTCPCTYVCVHVYVYVCMCMYVCRCVHVTHEVVSCDAEYSLSFRGDVPEVACIAYARQLLCSPFACIHLLEGLHHAYQPL